MGGSRLCMSLKVHRISSTNTSRKCVCPVQIVCISGFWGFAPRLHRDLLYPWTRLGTFVPQTTCAHPTSKPSLRHCFHYCMHNKHIGIICMHIRVSDVIRLTHCKCKSLMNGRRVCRLSVCLSVPRQFSNTKGDRREISSPLREIGVAEQEYDVRFCNGSS